MPRTGRRLHRHLGTLGLLGLAAAGAMASSGCSSEADGPCMSDENFFAQKVWAPIISQKCIGCHNPQGLAKDTPFVFKGSSEAGFLDANMQIFKNEAALERDGTSIVLLKPTKSVDHKGGVVIQKDSPDYQALSEMVQRLKEPTACETDVNAFYAGVVMATPAETLRMASLELAGRLPTDAEEQEVIDGGLDALDGVLDRLMTEEAFYVRLREIYNDLFLTDRYLNGGEDAVNLLSNETYDPQWYYGVPQDPALIEKYGAQDWDDLVSKLRSWTNRGIGREPLELIVHVVKENRSFQEILTAPYMVVNPFSAQAYGAYGATFQNESDPNEYAEATIDGIPHAGVLTSVMFLNRFPTTETNRNRHRSRMVYQFFLGTDILKTAEQPLDSSKITDFNPTMNNPSCTVCHAVIDPLAGTFHTFNEFGEYDEADTWLTDMRPPGFGNEAVPYEQFPSSLQWAAQRLANDPRFALSTVYTMFTGLTGQKPALAPPNSDPSFSIKFDAYLAQYHMFNAIAHDFIDSGYNLKELVKGLIKSPYFRARDYVGDVTPERAVALADVGGTRFLTPEQLHRKVWAVTGYPWRPRAFEDDGRAYDFLLRGDSYRMLYGGIDSEDVIARITEPNGIMANVADRMANEMACATIPRDLSLPTEERLLLPFVETTFAPKDANGFDVAPAVQAIKQNIQYLHKRVLGETLSIDDPEIERTFRVFVDTWQEGQTGMALNEGDEGYIAPWLPWPCQVHDDYWTREELPDEDKLTDDENYAVRSWMSVMTYLLSDYRFLYQ